MPALLALFTGTTEDVYLDVRKGRATGQAGNATTILTTIDADEFPVIPPALDGTSYALDTGALGRALADTLIAASSDTARGVLTGVYVEATFPTGLSFVASDAYRIHINTVATETAADGAMLVPAATCAYLARVLPDGKAATRATVTLSANRSQVQITVGNQTILATLLSEQFVNYRQILPKSIPAWVSVEAKALAAAVKALLPKDDAMLSVDLLADGDTILVSSTVGQRTVPGVTFGNFDGIFRLNGKYLLDALAPIGKGEATINVNTATHACTVINAGRDDGYTAVIMPQTTPR